ncbi:MAG TPA: nuclear transport factor 2 family protein [Novosphingobium sp.]
MTKEHKTKEHKAHVAIRNQLARLAQAGDARKGDIYAEIFTEDCLFQFGDDDNLRSMEGRETIRQYINGRPIDMSTEEQAAASKPKKPANPLGFISHHLTTSSIELVSDDEADVRTYWFVISPIGPDHSGFYTDRWHKVGDDWQLKHRRIRTVWRAENSYTRAKPAMEKA